MIQLQLSDTTEKKLQQVILLHSDNDIFFNKVIDYQINELKLGIYNIEKDLRKFEKIYSMNTIAFYEKFEKGEIGDDQDFMIWSGIYEMYMRDKQKLEKLQW